MSSLDQSSPVQPTSPIKVEVRPNNAGLFDVWGLYPFGTGQEWDLDRADFNSAADADAHINSAYEGIA